MTSSTTSSKHTGEPRTRLRAGPDGQHGGESSSLFAIGTTVLRNRSRIARWMLAGGLIGLVFAVFQRTTYASSASFIPQAQTSDASRSTLGALAGQLGVTLPMANQGLSPDFYVRLIKSRELLKAIVRDTLTVAEMGNRQIPFMRLFDIEGSSEAMREEEGLRRLEKLIKASSTKTTNLVEFSVETRWPSVSVAIANAVIAGINEFNQRMRHDQAQAERKFVEARLAVSAADLRASEDRLEDFMRTNRQFMNSPDLTFQRDRLQRDVGLKQQVFTSLNQSYEEVRIREVRDTPVITLVEQPSVPTLAEPSGRVLLVALGLLLGAFLGVASSTFRESVARRREAGDPYANEFSGTLGELKGEMAGRVQRLREKMRR